MHGTGTISGDSTELESIAKVLAEAGSRQKPLVVGAIKATVGHSEAVGFSWRLEHYGKFD
jgi:acyl transferase domain-containing protein